MELKKRGGNMFGKLKISVCIFLAAFFLSLPVSAKDYGNTGALKDISVVKAYFDVKVGEPAKLEKRLYLIDDTYRQLVKEGIKAEFIIGFRGEASYSVTKDDDYIFDDEDVEVKKKIYSWIKRFKTQGIVMEQCAISAGLYGIDPDDFVGEVEVVQNGYISIIAYQSKGYSLVPMH